VRVILTAELMVTSVRESDGGIESAFCADS